MSKRQLIMDTAIELFAEKGYEATSIQEITKHCGISKGAFYLDFKSKDELLYAIHDIFISYVLDKAKKAYATYDTPVSRLYAIIQSFTKVFGLYKSHITVFYQESMYLREEFQHIIQKKRNQYRDIILQVI